MADNEGKVLDAVLRFIEARDHTPRENDGRSPDDPKAPDPLKRVDYVCTVGQLFYASEHTRIEPFPSQIKLADQNQNLFDPIIERFDQRSDPELWDLIVPVDASAGLTVNDIGQVQDALTKWIEANAGSIPVAPLYERYVNQPLGESISGVPFRFSLHRSSLYLNDSRLSGRFRCMALADPSALRPRPLRWWWRQADDALVVGPAAQGLDFRVGGSGANSRRRRASRVVLSRLQAWSTAFHTARGTDRGACPRRAWSL